MIRLLFLCVILGINAAAQPQIQGRVTDTDSNALGGVYIIASGRVKGTITDVNGDFNYMLPEKSHFIHFYKDGFYKHTLKIEQNTTLLVKLKSIERRLEQWWVSLHDTIPIGKKSNNVGTTYIFHSDTLPLQIQQGAMPMVRWLTKGYQVYLPYDSVKDIYESEYFNSFTQKMEPIYKRKTKDPIPTFRKRFTENAHWILSGLALELLKHKALYITDRHNRPMSYMIVRKEAHCQHCSAEYPFYIKPYRKTLFDPLVQQ